MELKALIEVKETYESFNLFGGEVKWGEVSRYNEIKIISSKKLIPSLSSLRFSSLRRFKNEVDWVKVGEGFTGTLSGAVVPLDKGDFLLAFSNDTKYKKSKSG